MIVDSFLAIPELVQRKKPAKQQLQEHSRWSLPLCHVSLVRKTNVELSPV